MLTLNDGRSELWQWDTGRTLAVDADCSQVHFSNKVFGRSIDVDVVDGEAIIPDIILQTDKDLNVWAFVGTAENGYTKISKTFKVNRRNKPADYVFTPTDQKTLDDLQSQIGDLSDLTTEAKDTLVAAINEAARTGSGGCGLTTAQVKALDGMFKVAAYIKADVYAEYSAFKTAFSIEEATITGISATYSGGNVTAGTSVDELTGIVVTANYSDGSKRTVTGYALSGTIAEGINTITVTYEGMTTTFTVTGVAEEVTLSSISATYSGGDVAVGTAVTDLTGIVVTAHYSDGTSQTVTGYTLIGTIAEGSNTVTVTYQGKTATFTVTGVAESGGGDEPVDTTAKIAGTGYGLNKLGELSPLQIACYTEFYSFGRTIDGSDLRKVIYYVSSNNAGGMANANAQQVWQDDTFVTYWTTKYDEVNKTNFSGSYGPFNRVRFSLVTAYVDDDYAYFEDTGEVIFAGKNTPYYGMANIDGTMAVKV